MVRTLHTAIYGVMASAAFALLYAGVSGAHGRWLWVAAVLMTLEVAVFTASGMRCPLTAIAARNGAEGDGGSDTFLPERLTRHTARVFGPLLLVALVLLLGRFWWFGWR
ncbi:MAG TPA: hypothetical protein VIO94_11690 [Phenylobacterium sp.]